MKTMRDRDLRATVWRWLEADHAGDPNTLILDELGLLNGAARIDIAVINGEIAGFELKSARDTLDRLPGQRDLYSRALDRISLVVAENHLRAAEALIPEWWGLVVVGEDTDSMTIARQRAPRPNPNVEAAILASLLWRDEALALLERYGAAHGVRSKARAALYDRLAVALDLETLGAEVRGTLKSRTEWRADRRPRQCGG